jgi:hypothetical protein
MNRAGATRVLTAAAVLTLFLTGCHSSPRPDGGGKADPTVTPEQSRSHVLNALHDTWAELTPVNVTAPHGAFGSYTQCVDQGGAVLYQAEVRIDPKLSTDPPVGDRIEPALTAAGWTMQPRATPTGTGSLLHGTKNNLTIGLYTYTVTKTEPDYALLQILGPCLDVGNADQSYTSRADEPLPLP